MHTDDASKSNAPKFDVRAAYCLASALSVPAIVISGSVVSYDILTTGEVGDFWRQYEILVVCAVSVIFLGLIFFMYCVGMYKSAASLRQMSAVAIVCSATVALFAYHIISEKLQFYGYGRDRRITIMFFVAGASSGAWIAWQAWRVSRRDAPFLPRFSLKTMMLVVLAWGALLALLDLK